MKSPLWFFSATVLITRSEGGAGATGSVLRGAGGEKENRGIRNLDGMVCPFRIELSSLIFLLLVELRLGHFPPLLFCQQFAIFSNLISNLVCSCHELQIKFDLQVREIDRLDQELLSTEVRPNRNLVFNF